MTTPTQTCSDTTTRTAAAPNSAIIDALRYLAGALILAGLAVVAATITTVTWTPVLTAGAAVTAAYLTWRAIGIGREHTGTQLRAGARANRTAIASTVAVITLSVILLAVVTNV